MRVTTSRLARRALGRLGRLQQVRATDSDDEQRDQQPSPAVPAQRVSDVVADDARELGQCLEHVRILRYGICSVACHRMPARLAVDPLPSPASRSLRLQHGQGHADPGTGYEKPLIAQGSA